MNATRFRYSHAYSINFELKSFDHTGEHPSPTQLRAAILQRLASLTDTELIDAVGPPHDSSKLPPIVAVGPANRSNA
jgi:hypothetical protein